MAGRFACRGLPTRRAVPGRGGRTRCSRELARLNPSLHAYLARFDDFTRRQAREAEAAYRTGRALPLSGVPISIKEHLPARRGGDDLRLGHAPAPPHPARQRGCRQAERLGRGVHRQNQHRRIRTVGDQRQPARPGGRQPVGSHAHGGRLERRCGDFGCSRARERRAGRGRAAAQSVFRRRSPGCSASSPPTAAAPTKADWRQCRNSSVQARWCGARPMRGPSSERCSGAG